VQYFRIVPVPPPVLPDPVAEPGGRRRRSGAGKQFRKDVAADLVRYHPFLGRMPKHREEVAEEIAARITVLAIRTHVPWRGHPRPPVTLRMRHALRLLAQAGGDLTVTQLAERMGTGLGAASQLTTRMARRELVTKTRASMDKRVRSVRLTTVGWRHVPRDEPSLRERAWLPIGRHSDSLGVGRWIGAWPPRLRRVVQPPSALEEGLTCAGLEPAQLLAGLRAVQATVHGFDIERWEVHFDMAVSARRRLPRDREMERVVIRNLGRPTYSVRQGRYRRRRHRRSPPPPLIW
jgi:hypothetical protein